MVGSVGGEEKTRLLLWEFWKGRKILYFKLKNYIVVILIKINE